MIKRTNFFAKSKDF